MKEINTLIKKKTTSRFVYLIVLQFYRANATYALQDFYKLSNVLLNITQSDSNNP